MIVTIVCDIHIHIDPFDIIDCQKIGCLKI